ncbi:MAG TPA: carboxyl transferase domain-containing protein [Myxococcota bacterium]|nr:carboxyl transferase domain-containing protein [Myxococcota bacterium]
MSWQDEADEIARRRKRALEQGGGDAVERQHARGRGTVRERIGALADPESFREYGDTAGTTESADGAFTPTNVVMGTARIDGRPVVIGGDDFTISGGAYTQAALKKQQYADALAIRRRLPLVRLLEGGGASVSGGYAQRGRSGYDLTAPSPMNLLAMEALATVPVACAALGPCAGFPAARLVASHFSVMTRGTAQVLTGGPALVERALGAKLDKEELGGAAVHLASGVVDNGADSEADALAQIRGFLSYLPSNVWEPAPVAACDDPADRAEEELVAILPRNARRAYKIRRVLELVVDRGSLFELTPLFGRSQLTAFARLGGQPVGILANDCVHQGGAMTAAAARKLRRFVETCDAFHLPIVSFVDQPGFMIGPEAERAATIRFGMEALFAVQQTRVPWLAVVLRKSFGVAQGIHYGPGCTVIAWPSMQSGALPVESGVALAFGREIAAASDPEARRRELEEEIGAAQSVFPRAEDFGVHDLIDPRRTRPVLCRWIEEIQAELRLQTGPRAYGPRP